MGYATGEPREFTAGDTVTWDRTASGYSAADGWVLVYSFRGNASTTDYTATADGTGFTLTVSAADSALLSQGDYTVSGSVEKGFERFTVFAGRITVTANVSAMGTTFDGRTHVKKVLDAIEAVLESRATKEILQTNIEGVSISNIPHPELLELREKYMAYYKQEVAAENIAMGGASGARILTRFN
jgi:hypothetical protein